MTKLISIITPAYNEAENLPDLVLQINEAMKALPPHNYECIIVDDASTDNTPGVIRELSSRVPNLRYCRMEHNSGQSAALVAGMRMSKGEYLVTLDADLQNDPADIPAIIELLEKYDCVCGYREGRHDSSIRLITSYFGNLVRRRIVDDGIRDAGCGLKGFRRNCLEHIIPFHGVHRFFAAMVRNGGLTIAEVPVRHHPRIHGKSKYGLLNRLFWVLFDFVGVAWLRKRYRIISCREELFANPESTIEDSVQSK